MKTKVYYRIYKSPPPVPILSQIDPVHALPCSLSKINFNIILSMPSSSKWSSSFRFFPLKPLYVLLIAPYVLHVVPIPLFLIWSPNYIWWEMRGIKLQLCIMICLLLFELKSTSMWKCPFSKMKCYPCCYFSHTANCLFKLARKFCSWCCFL